jgi:DNA-binding response OmpR family regulator
MQTCATTWGAASRYELDVFGDGEAAVASIARRKPDLVLTDIMMPRLDCSRGCAPMRGRAPSRHLVIGPRW